MLGHGLNIWHPSRGSAAAPAVLNQTVTFGALTTSGAVGAKPVNEANVEVDLTGTPSLISGSAAGYTAATTGGRLTFTGSTGAPNGTVWRCNLVAGGTVDLTVNTVANARTVGSDAEFAVVAALSNAAVGSGGKSGLTCIMRFGTYASGGAAVWGGKLSNLSATFTLKGERQGDLRPTISDQFYVGLGTSDGFTHGDITFEDLRFTKTLGGNSLKYIAGGYIVVSEAAIYARSSNPCANINVRRCYFNQSAPNARLTGLRPEKRFPSIWLEKATTATVEDCRFEAISAGVYVDGSSITVRRNIFTGFWDDPVQVVPTNQAVSSVTVRDNIMFDSFADHAVHPDMLHFYGSGASASINGLEIAGNIFFPGAEGGLQPAWSTRVGGGAYTPEGALQVGNRTLTVTDGGKFVIVDASTSAATLTLGDPMSGASDTDIQVQAWFSPTAGITIANGGFTLYSLDTGTTITSLSLSNTWDTVQIRTNRAQTRWEIQRIGPTYQGVVGGTLTAGTSNLDIHHNIIWINDNAINIGPGLPFTGTTVEQNSFLPVWPNNGRGAAGYEPAGGNRFVVLSEGSGHRSAGNIASTFDSFAGAVTGSNILATELDLNNDWADMSGGFNVPNVGIEQVNPLTVAEAIAYARTKVSVATGIGALAPSSVDDEYVFFDGTNSGSEGLATNTPWFVQRLTVVAAGGGFFADWLPPGYTGFGAVTSYNCEYRINGGAWTSATVTGTTATVTTAAVNDVIDVRVRAVNANGNGKWTTAPAITVITPAAGIPTLTQLLIDTGTATVTDITTASFTVTGTKRLVIVVHLRRNTDVISSMTIGTPGRAYGAGTALTPVADASLPTADSRVMVYTTVASAGTYTVMMDRSLSSIGHRFSIYETNASGIGVTNTQGATSTSRTSTLTTTAPNSLILHAATVDFNGAASASITDTNLYATAITTTHWVGLSTENAATPGTYGATLTCNVSKAMTLASVELLS